MTTPDGNKTSFAYNQLGQRILTVLPDKTTLSRKYSASGLLLNATQPDGRSALFSYDHQGHLSELITFDGQVIKYRWNEQGELLAKQENDSLTRYSYDTLGRVNATLSDDGLLVQYKRNERGQLTETIVFDENAPDDKKHTYFEYDEAGRLIASKNNKGEITQQTFEGLSQPSSIIQPDGSALHLTYDKERNLTGIRRDDEASYKIAYDANENPIQITGFDGKQQRYQYDGNNRLTSLQESDKRVVHIQRDVMGRIIAQQASAQQGNENSKQIVNNTNRYQYDVRGNITRAHNPEVTLKQTFDRGNRLLSSQQIQGLRTHSLNYQYDELGRRKSLELPDGKTLHYRYNRQSQLMAIELSEEANSQQQDKQTLAAFEYDKQNRLKKQTFGNQVELKQTFDVFHRLTQQTLTHPEQRIYDQCDYEYDAIDQLISRQSQTQQPHQDDSGLTQAKQEAFEYNAIGQLVKESVAYTREQETKSKHTEFEWDSVGNPIAQRSVVESDELKTHTGDLENENNELSVVAFEDSSIASKENDQSIQAVTEGDRLLSFADIDFDYDDCGNQISELGVGTKTQRAFNAFNQLTSFSKDGVLTQYDYDPLGRRIAKHTEQGQIDFIWDGNQLLGECLNGQYTWYINRPNEFYPVALIKQDGIYYYHLDQLNTPRFVTNQAAEVVWENTANSYGYEDGAQQTREIESTNFYQPIRFQGQYFDQESCFHYNRFRYYCPKQQRFIHQDPIGIVGGINHYQYAPNPINWVDPMGLSCKEGVATVYKIANGGDMHFVIEVKTKFERVLTHQWGGMDDGKPTRTFIEEYDANDFEGQAITKSTIKLPNAIAAIDFQRQLVLAGNISLDKADWDPDKLDTPIYDVVNQSCLTHVFDILEAGELENVPKNSDSKDRSVRRFMVKMKKGELDEQPEQLPKYGGKPTPDGGRDSTNSIVFKDPNTQHLDNDETRKPKFLDGVMLPLEGTDGEPKKVPLAYEKNQIVERDHAGKTYRIKKDENAMPEFTIFETYLDDTHINTSDDGSHFEASNKRLGELLNDSPSLKDELGLDDVQYKHLTKNPPSKKSPPDLTWHHHQDTGKMQLVNKELHGRFGHVGGMERWGGGR